MLSFFSVLLMHSLYLNFSLSGLFPPDNSLYRNYIEILLSFILITPSQPALSILINSIWGYQCHTCTFVTRYPIYSWGIVWWNRSILFMSPINNSGLTGIQQWRQNTCKIYSSRSKFHAVTISVHPVFQKHNWHFWFRGKFHHQSTCHIFNTA